MTILLRVLIIDDSDDDTQLTLRQLQSGGYDPKWERVDTSKAMESALDREQWDVILCDYKMPRFTTSKALKIIQDRNIDIPFIMVSGAIGEDMAVAAMKSGVHDYIMKDKLSRLVPIVQRELREAESRIERKLVEKALQKSTQLLKATGKMAKIGGWEFDVETREQVWTEETYHIHEVDMTYKPTVSKGIDFYVPVSRAIIERAVQRAIEHGKPFDVELELITAKGNHRWVHAIGKAHQEQGKTKTVTGIFQDTTELKQTEHALRNSETRLNFALEINHTGVWDLNLPDHTAFRTLIHDRIFGYETLLPKWTYEMFLEHVLPDDRPEVDRCFREAMATQSEWNFECRIRRTDGEVRWIMAKGQHVRTSQGEPVRMLGIVQDITERKGAEAKLQQTLESLKKAISATIQTMVSAVEMRDPYTSDHQLRVANIACAIAMEMELSQEKVDGIRMAGSIHDIGKLSIPAEILVKPTKLTNIEFFLIKEHSRIGYEMLKDVEFAWPLAQIVYQHHERMDGSGYPRNLKGEEILMEARIMAVADVVEAMASHRPYRPALGIEVALEEIEKNRGTLYDDAVADACLKLFREKGYKLT